MTYRRDLLELAARVRNALTPELLKPKFRGCRRVGKGFLTREPSKRSRIVIERVRATCLA